MQRFTFRLETVRRLREQEELERQQELAAAMRVRNQLLAELERSLGAERDLYEYLRTGGLDAPELAHVANFGELHRQKIFELRTQLHNVEQSVERSRQRVVDARARREALDRLKERQRRAHRAAELALEGRELDELATLRHRHGRPHVVGLADADAGGAVA